MHSKGFTFIEVIITVAIFSFIIVSVYSVFNMGMKVWKRQSEYNDSEKTRIALLKVQKELKDSFYFSGLPFKGSKSEMVFPLSISVGENCTIYQVKYYVEEENGVNRLIRAQKPFAMENMNIAIQDEIKKELFNAALISFSYGYKLAGYKKGFEWRDNWNDSQIAFPSAVRISFNLKGNSEIYTKTIFIPHGKQAE